MQEVCRANAAVQGDGISSSDYDILANMSGCHLQFLVEFSNNIYWGIKGCRNTAFFLFDFWLFAGNARHGYFATDAHQAIRERFLQNNPWQSQGLDMIGGETGTLIDNLSIAIYGFTKHNTNKYPTKYPEILRMQNT